MATFIGLIMNSKCQQTLVTAQNLRLQAEQDRLELQQRQMINSMQLIAALGTGWGRD